MIMDNIDKRGRVRGKRICGDHTIARTITITPERDQELRRLAMMDGVSISLYLSLLIDQVNKTADDHK